MSVDQEFEGPDLVVAGAGGGLVAALRAAELGLSVLVVERNEHFAAGNNTSMSTAMIPGAGSRWQRDEDIDDSAEVFLGDLMAKTNGEADPVVARALAEVSAPLVEWMADSVQVPLSLVTDFHYPGHSRQRCHSIEGRAGRTLLQYLLRRVRESELIDLLVPARLVDVTVGADGVESVTVEGPGGTEQVPTRALVLATNGFGADADLVSRYIPEISEAIYHGSEGSTGDALRIGERLGAATGFLDAYQGHAALAMPAATLAGWATVMHGGFLVDRRGQRFGDETTGYSEYAARVLEKAQDGEAWILLDERIHDACLEFQDYRDVVSSGGVRWAPTAEELAHMIGVDPVGLCQTFEQVRASANGADDPFGRRTWSSPLAPPFGAVFVKPALFHTQGGLRVDGRARVQRVNGEAISGLYAAGGAAVGISGHGAGGYLAGNGLLSAFGLSYLAATDVAHARRPHGG